MYDVFNILSVWGVDVCTVIPTFFQEYEHEYAEFLYDSPSEFDKRDQAWLVRIGRNIAKPSYRVGPRRIECYSIHFVQEGHILFEYDGQQRLLGPGDLFCMYTGITYLYYKNQDKESLRLTWMAMDGPGMEDILTLLGLSRHEPYLLNRCSPMIEEHISGLMNVLRQKDTANEAVRLDLRGRFYSLLGQLMSSSERQPEHRVLSWVSKSLDYIRLHATEGITVQQIARLAGLNRTYFSTEFRSAIGVSPVEYIARVRMDKAKELLSQSTATVTEIAYSVGYTSLYSFTRAFKNHCRMSPTDYRNLHTANS